MNYSIVIVFLLAYSVYIETAFVDNLEKCSIKDTECQRSTFSNVIKRISKTGIPELSIPSIDPLELKNIAISILGLVDLKLTEGNATGANECSVDKFAADIDKESGQLKIKCDLIRLEGSYLASASIPLFKELLGSESIHGEGNGKIDIENIIISLDFKFFAQKRDGEIYLKCDFEHINYDYEILGKIKLFADNLYVGQKESSKEITKLFNDNWRVVMGTFGKIFIDKALQICFDILSKFFDFVPAKYYITDDLSPYAKA